MEDFLLQISRKYGLSRNSSERDSLIVLCLGGLLREYFWGDKIVL